MMNKKIILGSILSIFLLFPVLAVDTPKPRDYTLNDNGSVGTLKYENDLADDKKSEITAESKSYLESNESIKPAAKLPNGIQFGAGVSVTSGVNAFVGYANKDFESFWWKRIGGRVDFGTSSPLKSTINSAISSAVGDGQDIGDGLTITGGSLSAQHFGALIDIYPFGDTWFLGGIRFTGGYVTGKFNLSANLSGEVEAIPGEPMEFELDGNLYRYNGNDFTGTASVKWKYSGPYLGTGFDLGMFWGIKMYMDAGVVFSSRDPHAGLNVPINDKLQYSSNGGASWTAVEGNASMVQQFEDARDNALADANQELDDIKMFPLVKLGLMYRF